MKFFCWGWSNVSEEEAARMAEERTRKVVEILNSGQRLDCYHYADRPIRELILQEWKRADGTLHAAITRNIYGCEVLNTAQVMFVDIDIPDPSAMASLSHKISKLFGSKALAPKEALEEEALSKLRQLIDADPQCGARVYRTRGGLRYLFTHQLADPTNEATLAFMDSLGADPLYVQLCKSQQCFRARLTPKPWRCGHHSLSTSYRHPAQTTEAQRMTEDWVGTYTTKARQFSTCSFISAHGPQIQHPEIFQVVEVHDRITRCHEGLPLA